MEDRAFNIEVIREKNNQSATSLVQGDQWKLSTCFLLSEEKTHYYQASFWIPSIKYSSDLSEEQSKLQINLKQKINNEVNLQSAISILATLEVYKGQEVEADA